MHQSTGTPYNPDYDAEDDYVTPKQQHQQQFDNRNFSNKPKKFVHQQALEKHQQDIENQDPSKVLTKISSVFLFFFFLSFRTWSDGFSLLQFCFVDFQSCLFYNSFIVSPSNSLFLEGCSRSKFATRRY